MKHSSSYPNCTVAENYGICAANAARLIGLQDWVRAQQDLK